MWNWADDHGRGTSNLKELEGFIFPNDDVSELSSGNTVHFRDLVAEVAACFNVVFYEAEGRPYYAITTWDDHQRNERRASQSKYPEPTGKPAFSWLVAEIPSQRTVDPNISVTGTGEQGNSGTEEEEQGEDISSEVATATTRPDVEAILDHLESKIKDNGARTPTRGTKARDAVRLMLDRDGRTQDQVIAAIDYATGDEFWRANILSAAKLREKYDQLSLNAQRDKWKRPTDRNERKMQFWQSEVDQARAFDENQQTNRPLEIEAS